MVLKLPPDTDRVVLDNAITVVQRTEAERATQLSRAYTRR